MKSDVLPVFLITIGILAMVVGWLARAGRYKYWLRWYDDPSAPFYLRNAALAWIPAGGAVTLLGTALLLMRLGAVWEGVGVLVGGMSFGCTFGALLITWFTPPWSKPRWLRQRDAERPPPPEIERDRLAAWFVGIVTATISIAFLLMGILLILD